jgi:predicted HAD superfamily Cof-like phosphohydrolase
MENIIINSKIHFEKVCDFNRVFNYPVFNVNIASNETPKEAKYRYDLIYEEGIVELGRAIRNNDMKETKDAIADLLYVAYGTLYTYNIDLKNLIDYKLVGTEYKQIERCIENARIGLLNDKDIIYLSNALLELISYTYMFGYSLNIDVDSIFTMVHESNMSKVCIDEEEAIMTVDSYKNKYNTHCELYDEYCVKYGKDSEEALSIYSPYDTPYYYKSGEYWLVKNKSTGKALKSINYKPVNII